MRQMSRTDLITTRNRRPIKEIADYLRISDKTAARWIRSGKLEAVRVGGRIYSSRPAADACQQSVNGWNNKMQEALG